MYKLSPWDLSEIKPKQLEEALKVLEKKTQQLEKKRSLLKESISVKDFMALLQEMEQLRAESSKISSYSGLLFSENSSNQQALADMSKVENVLTKINNRLLFFSLWFKDVSEPKAKELINASGKYHYYLEQMRKYKPYTLKENEEKIINIKDMTGASALNTVYTILTSQLKFTVGGKELTQEEVMVKVRDPSAQVRKEAYTQLLSKYAEFKDVIGEVYKNLVNDWREEQLGLRGYKTPLQVRNFANDVPDKAVEVLLKVCEKNQSLFHRFFEVKRKKLGLKKLTRFDLYAPLEAKKAEYSYDEAVKLVLDSYGKFSFRFRQEAEHILESKHVHSTVQKNKQSGAFCSSVTAKLPPYVLLSYTGALRDVSTLAHELGHGVHHRLASEQTEFTFHSCLPLAETASILGEMILSEELKKKDPARAKELLFFKLDDLYASIIRQAGFVAFEMKAHTMMEEGKTMEDISTTYLANLRKQLGPIEVDDLYAQEWLYISHIFHTPFYCYAYAFGNLLTLALYDMYTEQGEKMVPKIIEMFSYGGSESPIEITTRIGVDITSEKFWQKGFDAIERMIEEVE